MSTSKRIFHSMCASPKVCPHFDQTIIKNLKTVSSILVFFLYLLKVVLNYFLALIHVFEFVLWFYYRLFIIIYNFIIIYSFIFLLFVLFICSYFWVFLDEKKIFIRKWGFGLNPHFFGCFIKKLGVMLEWFFIRLNGLN